MKIEIHYTDFRFDSNLICSNQSKQLIIYSIVQIKYNKFKKYKRQFSI